MNNNRLYYLLDKYFQKKQTPEEKSELVEMLSKTENESVVKQWIDEGFSKGLSHEMSPLAERDILQTIFKIKPGSSALQTGTVRHIPFLRTAWLKYAAAIVIMAGVGAYLWSTAQKENNIIADIASSQDIAPGTNRATITLADGNVIVIDSAANGQLANDGGAIINKSEDGKIIYSPKHEVNTKAVSYNTMSTPKGGQYQLVLPDGTKVWLNAASSITFPTVFAGPKRDVRITGEVYFEVAQQKNHPFMVEVVGRQKIEVLGTHFNVNAYGDEPYINTTLLEGSVKVKAGSNQQLLRPGQQTQLGKTDSIHVINDIDPEQVMAWKSGHFSFRRSDLPTIMRELARWYDVTVEYRGNIPTAKFGGDIPRNVNVSEALKILEVSRVHFIIESKKIIVIP